MVTMHRATLSGFSLALLALLSGVSLTTGCGDDAVAYSETISTKLAGIKDGELTNGSASVDKNINTESGNPYADFLKTARSRLGGHDPSSVTPILITVRVDADSKKVASLEQVFTGLEVFFANSQTTIPVARVTTATGTSLSIPILSNVDYEPIAASMLSGDFKVGVRGTTVSPAPTDFELKLTLDIRFRANP